MTTPDINIVWMVRGRAVTLRPITPADRDIEAAFVRKLSVESRTFRFHTPLRELTPMMLDYFTQNRYPDAYALIATTSLGSEVEQIAVARYARYPGSDAAEVAIAVADEWQGDGLGTRMLTELREIAAEAGIRDLYLNVLPDNKSMLRLAHSLGFHPKATPDPGMIARGFGKFIGRESGDS